MEVAEVCDETPSSHNNLDKGRPPLIALTSEVNLLSLQKDINAVVSGEFFRNTTSGTRITTKRMADYKATQNLSGQKGLPFFTFYIKGDKPVKAVIRRLPNNNLSEDITVALQELGYEVVSVKQMTAKFPSPEGEVTIVSRSLDIVKISSPCNIIFKAEA
jgi:hypothetical protein